MNSVLTVFKREFMGYFRTPVAYVFIIVFLIATIGLTWYLRRFFDANQANLVSFFEMLPWIFLFLIPAAGMRLWAEEKRSGTWELLFTLPLSVSHAVIGKFLAGWAFISVAILLTFTMPLTTGYLGDPDWGPVITGYIGAILMAGSYLSICSLTSSLTENQVISFVISISICIVLVLLGWSFFNDLLISANFPVWLVDGLANFSFITHFDAMIKGLVTLSDIFFFASLTAFCLFVNILILER